TSFSPYGPIFSGKPFPPALLSPGVHRVLTSLFQQEVKYELKDARVPRLTGRLLQIFAWTVANLGHLGLIHKLLSDSNMFLLLGRNLLEARTLKPLVGPDDSDCAPRSWRATPEQLQRLSQQFLAQEAVAAKGPWSFHGALDFHQAYLAGTTTPLEVAEQLLAH